MSNNSTIILDYWNQINGVKIVRELSFATDFFPNGALIEPYYNTVSSRSGITAIEVDSWASGAASKILLIYDEYKNEIIHQRPLSNNQFLINEQDGNDFYHILTQNQDMSAWTINKFSFTNNLSFGIGYETILQTITANNPPIKYGNQNLNDGGFVNTWIDLLIPANSNGVHPGFALIKQASSNNPSNPYTLYIQQYELNGSNEIIFKGGLQSIKLPPTDFQWFGHAYVKNDELFINVGSHDSSETEWKYNYNTVNANWINVDRDFFWKGFNDYTDGNTIIRYEDSFINLRSLKLIGSNESVKEDFAFPIEKINDNQIFISFEAESDSHPIGYEKWAIYDIPSNTIVSSRNFDSLNSGGNNNANIIPGGYQTRIINDFGFDQTHIYFQTVNLTATFSGSRLISTNQNTNTPVSVYKIPVSQIQNYLNNNFAPIKIIDINGFNLTSRITESRNEVVALGKFIPLSDGNFILSYSIWNQQNDSDQYGLIKFDNNFEPLHSTRFIINNEPRSVIVDSSSTGFIYFSTDSYNYEQSYFLYDLRFGVGLEISRDEFLTASNGDLLNWSITNVLSSNGFSDVTLSDGRTLFVHTQSGVDMSYLKGFNINPFDDPDLLKLIYGFNPNDHVDIDIDEEVGITLLSSSNNSQKYLVRAEIDSEKLNNGISYEHWIIIELYSDSTFPFNYNVTASKAFVGETGAKVRSVLSVDELDNNIYFQNLNINFSKNSSGEITGATQPNLNAVSLHRISLDNIETVLAHAQSDSNIQSLVGQNNVSLVANFSQNQLTGTLTNGQFSLLGAFWQASNFVPGDNSFITASLLFSNLESETPQTVLSKVIPSNPNPLSRRIIEGDIEDIIQDYSNGIIFFKTEENNNFSDNRFYAFDIKSGFIVALSREAYTNIENSGGVPDSVSFVFGTSANDLSLGDTSSFKDQRIYGGNGNDTMRGGFGNDVFFGGNGFDTVLYNDTFENYHIARSIYNQDKFIAVNFNINNRIDPSSYNNLPDQKLNFLVARSINDVDNLTLIRIDSINEFNFTNYFDFYIPLQVDTFVDVEQLIFNNATVHIYNRSEIGQRNINGSSLNRDIVLINGHPDEITFTKINDTTIEIRFMGSGASNALRINNNINSLMFSELSSSYQLQIPWSTNLTQKDLDDYFLKYIDPTFELNTSNSNIITNSPSNFSDFIDHYISAPLTNSVDALGGNDYIFTHQSALSPNFNTIRGGAGDDYIYVGHVDGTFNVFGDAGNDIITVNRVSLSTSAFVNIDGGAGNDTYRIALNNSGGLDSRIHIHDTVGINSLILAVNNNSSREGFSFSEGLSYVWEDNQLRITDQFGSTPLTASLNSIRTLTFTYDGRYFNNHFFSGNLVNPVVLNFTNGQLTGTAGSDILLPIAGVRLNYNGGAGDDLIIMNAVSGGVVQGGLGNDIILVDDPNGLNPRHTLSYAWTAGGTISEINLKFGFGYTMNAQGVLQGSDRFEGKYFDGVIGGAGNETIYGNEYANILDGGAGNDIIFSGRNLAGEGRNILIGGAGNDILIEQTVWKQGSPASLFSGSLMQGGAGDDIYVLMTGGAPSTLLGERFTPTKIVERNPNNTNAGGNDTIRLLEKGGEGIGLYSFSQVGNTVRVDLGSDDHEFDNLKVGDTILLGFLNGRTSSNGYTVNRVIKDPDTAAVVGFEVTSPIVAAQSGSVFVSEFEWRGGIGYWADNDYFAHFSYKASEDALNNVFDGQNLLTYYDGEQVSTPLQLIALIDRHAMDFVEVGGVDPLGVGMRMPISFNQGRSNDLEVIVAGSNGNAVLFGGNGTDIIHDTPYNDILIGGAGHDLLVSYFGFDIMIGGDGNDFLRFRSDGQIMVGGSGADHFQVAGIGNRAALITDFKSWEGDRVSFDHDWLTKNRSFNVEEENSLLVRTLGDTASFWLNSTNGQEHFLDVIFNQESDYQTVADQLAAQLPGSWDYWHQT